MKTYSKKWMRARFTPCLPLGADGRLVTGSEKHIQLSRQAATEGMVLLKNEENIKHISSFILNDGNGCM